MFNPQKEAKEYTALEIISLHLEKYLNLPKKEGSNELEVRFGTRNIHRITKIDLEQVIQKLKSLNFVSTNETGNYTLNIQNEFVDLNTGKTKLSNLRTTIEGFSNIQTYCKTNSIEEVKKTSRSSIIYLLKSFVKDGETTVFPVNVDDFNLRISYQNEKNLDERSSMIKSMLSNWADTKKVFRLINRVTYTHPSYPFKVDISIVKMGRKNKRGQIIPVYKLEDSDLFSNPETYEIELELDNTLVAPYYGFDRPENVEKAMKKLIKIIVGGLQNTHYPISYPEQTKVLDQYMTVLHGEKHEIKKILPKHFCGPSSYTLELKNVQPLNEDFNVPNIRNKYTVTDKADGTRKLLFINGTGKIYLINMRMLVEFTGTFTKDKKIFNTIIDGEHILHNKNGRYINLFAAFDIYYINGKSVRDKQFAPQADDEVKNNFRLPLLVKIIKSIKIEGVTKKEVSFRVEYKKFYTEGVGGTIFDGCNTILKNEKEGMFEYETDGLIFTPMEMGVGGNKKNEASSPFKTTWIYSFKWKPPEFNTIDFLISTLKDANNNDKISNIFQTGSNLTQATKLDQFKTLVLRCGFDEKKHGYLNPCKDMIDDNLPKVTDKDDNSDYKPVPFYPTKPYDSEAHICNIFLQTDDAGNKQMMTTDGEVFTDNMIVEFKYDATKEKASRWIPIRVRYDKTAEFRQGIKNYGNAYHVANSNWHSIHYPITHEMISTGVNIPSLDVDDDVYYNRISKVSFTKALRDFHNLYVKLVLIKNVSNKGDTLVDFAVGKGGDFTKWIKSKLAFVFGIDISKDNIENRLDGACARYLNYKKQFRVMPSALFVNGNSAMNIRNTDAMYSEKDKMITKGVFGEGPKDPKIIGKGVVRSYGVGSEGFSVSSCQFALHYFFENARSLENFLRNVSECTKVGGYFIGTCYDGNEIFNALKTKKQGEGIVIKEGEHKLWELRKEYDHDEFNPDVTSLGYSIDVFQETINQFIREYLVNFDYFVRCMENYGFIVEDGDDIRKLGFPRAIGNFSLLHQQMESKLQSQRRMINEIGKANEMTANEKKISFFNNYFIFKKVRNVDASKISLSDAVESVEVVETVVPEPPKENPVKKKGRKPKLKIKKDDENI